MAENFTNLESPATLSSKTNTFSRRPNFGKLTFWAMVVSLLAITSTVEGKPAVVNAMPRVKPNPTPGSQKQSSVDDSLKTLSAALPTLMSQPQVMP